MSKNSKEDEDFQILRESRKYFKNLLNIIQKRFSKTLLEAFFENFLENSKKFSKNVQKRFPKNVVSFRKKL